MDKQTSLNLFRDALDAAAEQLEAELKEKTEAVVVTREQHEKGVARVMSAFRRHTARRVKRRVLIALIAAALAILTSCTIYVNREKIASFVEEFYHTYIDVSYSAVDESAPEEILEVYLPAYVPEGYEIANVYRKPSRVRTEWKNGEGEEIILLQNLLDSVTSWDNERVDPEILTVNDRTIYYAEYDGTLTCMWNDGRYSFKLKVTDEQLRDELEKMLTLTVSETE